jgi:hypothetical protein
MMDAWPSIRAGLVALTVPPGWTEHCIHFSCKPYDCGTRAQLPRSPIGNTNISAAFQRMREQMEEASKAGATEMAIVFVSDGDDSDARRNLRNLAALAPPPVPCCLFCVGVGGAFPTTLVVNTLRPLFHTVGTSAWPAVVSLFTPADASGVFQDVEALLFRRPPPVEAVGPSTPLPDLVAFIQQRYNRAMLEAVARPERAEAALEAAVADVDRAVALVERLGAVGGADEVVEDFQPLASRLLQLRDQRVDSCLGTAKNFRGQLCCKLKALRSKDLMLGALSEADKAELLSWGHHAGKHVGKALAYHSADWEKTRASVASFLRSWRPNEADRALCDKVFLASQEEYFADAQLHADAILPRLDSVLDLVKLLPIVCRTLTIRWPLPAGILMNPWLGKVEAMPTIVTHVTLHTFFAQLRTDKVRNGERINGLMLVSGDPSGLLLSKALGKFLSTYLLVRNHEVFLFEADLATWAMVLVHLLNRPTMADWMGGEMASIRLMHDSVYGGERTGTPPQAVPPQAVPPKGPLKWQDYVDCVRDGCERNPLAPAHCPHLNKFVLACWIARVDDLEARRDAAIIEFVRRLPADAFRLESLFHLAPQDQELPPVPVLPTLRATQEAYLNLVRLAPRADPPPPVPVMNTAYPTSWNLSVGALDAIFRSLATTLGRPPVPPLDHATWLRLLVTGATPLDKMPADIGARGWMPSRPLSPEEVVGFIQDRLHPLRRTRLATRALARASKDFEARPLETHGVPAVLSAPLVDRFRAEFGRDLAADLSLTDYGLSRTACLCPACPFFGRVLGRPGRGRQGQPIMNAALVKHLALVPSIPAFHRDRLHADTKPILASLSRSNAGGQWLASRIAADPFRAMAWDEMVAAFAPAHPPPPL